MAFIEELRQKQIEDEKKGKLTPEAEQKGPRLQEILDDSEQSQLFGSYLKSENLGDLAEGLLNRDLKRADLDALESRRKGFLEMMDKVKSVTEELDQATFDEVVATNPDLKALNGLVSKEEMRDAITESLSEIAINDRGRFGSLDKMIQSFKATKESIAKRNEEIEKICEVHGLPRDKYMEALKSRDPQALENLVVENMGFMKRLFANQKGLNAEVRLIDKRSDIQAHIAQYESSLKTLGGSLSGAFNNEKVNALFVASLSKDSGEKTPEASFAESANALRKEAVKKARKKYHKDHEKDQGYSVAKADADFSKEYMKNTMKGKEGFWSTLMKSCLDDFIKGAGPV